MQDRPVTTAGSTRAIASKHIIIVFGPTGVGKTAFVDLLSQHIPLEVINMDMGQQYVPLTIGTSKPDLKKATMPHHLFDSIAEPVNTTVVAYRAAVIEKIAEIHTRQALPVLVGGSGFYLKSLLFPPRGETYGKITLSVDNKEDLWKQLAHVDPARAARLHHHDHYRIERALALWYEKGIAPSALRPLYNPPAPYLLYYLVRDRNDLYDRINKRVYQMIDEGLIEEAHALYKTSWQPWIRTKKIIGYQELFDYQEGIISREQAIERIQQRTRNYAKRQMTFWRMLIRALEEHHAPAYRRILNLTETSINLYIDHLLKDILGEDIDEQRTR